MDLSLPWVSVMLDPTRSLRHALLVDVYDDVDPRITEETIDWSAEQVASFEVTSWAAGRPLTAERLLLQMDHGLAEVATPRIAFAFTSHPQLQVWPWRRLIVAHPGPPLSAGADFLLFFDRRADKILPRLGRRDRTWGPQDHFLLVRPQMALREHAAVRIPRSRR